MLKCDFKLRHGCSPVNLLHIFRTPFYKNTSGLLLLEGLLLIAPDEIHEAFVEIDENLTIN